jgi:hypothetical protein
MNVSRVYLKNIAIAALVLGGLATAIVVIVFISAASQFDPDAHTEAVALGWLTITGSLLGFGLLALLFWLLAESIAHGHRSIVYFMQHPESKLPGTAEEATTD